MNSCCRLKNDAAELKDGTKLSIRLILYNFWRKQPCFIVHSCYCLYVIKTFVFLNFELFYICHFPDFCLACFLVLGLLMFDGLIVTYNKQLCVFAIKKCLVGLTSFNISSLTVFFAHLRSILFACEKFLNCQFRSF